MNNEQENELVKIIKDYLDSINRPTPSVHHCHCGGRMMLTYNDSWSFSKRYGFVICMQCDLCNEIVEYEAIKKTSPMDYEEPKASPPPNSNYEPESAWSVLTHKDNSEPKEEIYKFYDQEMQELTLLRRTIVCTGELLRYWFSNSINDTLEGLPPSIAKYGTNEALAAILKNLNELFLTFKRKMSYLKSIMAANKQYGIINTSYLEDRMSAIYHAAAGTANIGQYGERAKAKHDLEVKILEEEKANERTMKEFLELCLLGAHDKLDEIDNICYNAAGKAYAERWEKKISPEEEIKLEDIYTVDVPKVLGREDFGSDDAYREYRKSKEG